MKTCESCECCRCISELLTDHIVKCALHSPQIATKHELPISHGLSDNSWAFQNFVKNVLDIEAELCQTVAAGSGQVGGGVVGRVGGGPGGEGVGTHVHTA